ncbi:MAG: NAD-dependent epimerase/dehydratase family protein, partial [Gammaproteobacteria bacterium]|nr:NAD-dependent epimerase/dehydratase family protein [Gammaproteobacteria bacterium]NIT41137.1 NAD-dependent epimerase/dehydratase family protein [Gammaproteobacteria bacterium]
MKWLITGGCGFLGTSLVSTLVQECHHSIRIVDNLSVGARADLQQVTDYEELSGQNHGCFPDNGVQLMVGDVLDETLINSVIAGADIVVHLAANTGVEPSVKNPQKDCIVNVIGTLNCLEAARNNHVKRFVFAS